MTSFFTTYAMRNFLHQSHHWFKTCGLVHLIGIYFGISLFVLLPVQTTLAADHNAYHKMTLEGWQVNVEQSLVKNNDPRVYTALKILSRKLQEVKTLLPQHKVSQLINIPIWLSRNSGRDAEFYFFEQRIYRNDKNPDMLDGIEFHNINVFIKAIPYNPMLVLHELAHAYHKLNFDRIDKTIMRAYKHAEQEKLYRDVMYLKVGKKKKAYALKNSFEYFAELTETYFGRNDFYPFTRSELQRYDPVGYQMIETVWK